MVQQADSPDKPHVTPISHTQAKMIPEKGFINVKPYIHENHLQIEKHEWVGLNTAVPIWTRVH